MAREKLEPKRPFGVGELPADCKRYFEAYYPGANWIELMHAWREERAFRRRVRLAINRLKKARAKAKKSIS